MRGSYTSRMLILLTLLGCHGDKPSDSGGTGSGGGDSGAPLGDVDASLLAEGQLNFLLPVRVAIDAAHRRAWAVGNGLPTLAEVDLDAGALVTVLALGDDVNTKNLHVTTDGLGTVWILQDGAPAVLRVDPSTGEVVAVDILLDQTRRAVGLPEGGLIAAGPQGDGVDQLVRVGADGLVEDRVDLDVSVAGATLLDDGTVAAYAGGADGDVTLDLYDPTDLSLIKRCDSDVAVTSGLAELTLLPRNRVAATHDGAVAILGCETDWVEVAVGTENRSPVWVDDTLYVLDRIGPKETQNPNYGVAHRMDVEGNRVGAPLTTGKNSGYGAYDAGTGLVWYNSEGTGELWGMDPLTGEVGRRVRLGAHVEGVAGDPTRPGLAWFAGRLTSTVGRLDGATGELRTVSDEIRWPMAPLVHDGALWLLDGIEDIVYGLDPDTLEVRYAWPLGTEPNGSLTLNDLGWDEARGSLWVAHAGENAALEVDPSTGAIRSRWELGGGPVRDPDLPGRLELVMVGDAVLVVRDNDGAVTRIDPETGDTVEAALDGDTVVAMITSLRLDRVQGAASAPRFWALGQAYDADTLLRDSAADLDADFVIGERDGGWLVWDNDAAAVRQLDAAGAEVASWPLTPDARGEPNFALVPGEAGDRLVVGEFSTATVRSLGL